MDLVKSIKTACKLNQPQLVEYYLSQYLKKVYLKNTHEWYCRYDELLKSLYDTYIKTNFDIVILLAKRSLLYEHERIIYYYEDDINAMETLIKILSEVQFAQFLPFSKLKTLKLFMKYATNLDYISRIVCYNHNVELIEFLYSHHNLKISKRLIYEALSLKNDNVACFMVKNFDLNQNNTYSGFSWNELADMTIPNSPRVLYEMLQRKMPIDKMNNITKEACYMLLSFNYDINPIQIDIQNVLSYLSKTNHQRPILENALKNMKIWENNFVNFHREFSTVVNKHLIIELANIAISYVKI